MFKYKSYRVSGRLIAQEASSFKNVNGIKKSNNHAHGPSHETPLEII